MTEAEMIVAVATFRKEVEDLVVKLINRFYFNNDGVAYTDEGTVQTHGVAYEDEDEVLSLIPEGLRFQYLTVNIAGVEYWFIGTPLALEPKFESLSIADGSITLAKLANMATASILGRVTAGAGVPEVLSVAQVLTLLGLDTLIAADLSTFVTKVNGSSLVPDTEIAKIHAAGSDDQDLSGKVDVVAGESLMTDAERAKLALLTQIYTIILPAASTVQGRCNAAVEITNYPENWTIAADGTIPADLVITHGLDQDIADVKIYSVDGTSKRLLYENESHSGIIAPDKNTLNIESLATIETEIYIFLIFA